MNTATPADLWPTSKTKTGQREGEDGGKRVRIREKKEEERWDSSGAEGEPKLVLVGPLLRTHLAFHVMLLKITVYTYLLWTAAQYWHCWTEHTHTHTRYLSLEASVFTSALSDSASPRLLHLHFFWILQLQGLQLLDNTGATAKKCTLWLNM